jgi:REP element-mobilizing transposase RayT
MPRKARLDIPGTLHHLMIRGIEGSNIFRDDEDRNAFINRMSTLVKETGTRVLAWVLMDNHIHLLIISGPVGLSTFMRRLLTGYAYNFNRRYKRSGHLFQNRYKSIVCDLDSYLLELVRYIHLNPIRANVVKTLNELEQYPWCGHGVLSGKNKNGWQEREFVLGFFGAKEKVAVKAYHAFMEAGKEQGRRPELVGGGLIRSVGGWSRVLTLRNQGEAESFDDRILGDGDFVQDILTEADQRLTRQIRARKKTGSISQWINKRCKESGISGAELRSGSRRRAVSELRKEICIYLSRELGVSMAEIAREVGVGTSGVAMVIKREKNCQK